jgi:hypothetical protein
MEEFFSAVKRQVQKLPLALFFPIYYAWFSVENDVWAARLRRQLDIPPLSDLDLLRVKGSETVFILGSGQSINKITPQRWEVIKANDTIALNNWLVHPFVPKFYCFDSAPRTSRSEPGLEAGYDFLLKNIWSRATDYRRTIKIVSNLRRGKGCQIVRELPSEWRENLYFGRTPPVVARTKSEFTAMVRYYKARGTFAQLSRSRNLFKYNSILVTCLSVAIRLGYRRIVLCGVDLSSNHYFYHDPHFFPETAEVSLAPREEQHDTVVAKSWLVPIDEMLIVIRDEILQPSGIELYVESTSSLLYPRIASPPESMFETGTAGTIEPRRK